MGDRLDTSRARSLEASSSGYEEVLATQLPFRNHLPRTGKYNRDHGGGAPSSATGLLA